MSRLWILTRRVCNALVLAVFALSGVPGLQALPNPLSRGKWTELNIGPYYLYAREDVAQAREQLTQLEQLRWVLGGLLDSQDLPAPWPIRIVFAKSEKTNPADEFVWKSAPLFGQIGFVTPVGQPAPLESVARILLQGNTPRLPDDAESGLIQLLGSLQARGSHVTWGGPVAHPDLAWARMQLFATRFEYSASFHIFVTSLRNGSSVRVAERNAFNKEPAELEKEAQANLQAGNWTAVSVSGRPLDPKRDFGEHAIPDAVVNAYLAAGTLDEQAFRDAVEGGPDAKPLGLEGLAAAAARDRQDPKPELQNAVHAGSKSAPVYLMLGDWKTAEALNPRWAEPVHVQAEAAANPVEKEALLNKAIQIDPRDTAYWIELAELQATDGHPELAYGSWLRAEDSAPTQDQRDRIEQVRVQKEQERLEALAAKAKADRQAAFESDQKAQGDEMARIHAAEQKANASLDAAAGGSKPETVLPWQDVVAKHSLTGMLVRIDCLSGSDRLSIKDRAGKVMQLLLPDPSKFPLSCGPQSRPRRVSLTYADGRILSLELK